jgi:hypothetical protein
VLFSSGYSTHESIFGDKFSPRARVVRVVFLTARRILRRAARLAIFASLAAFAACHRAAPMSAVSDAAPPPSPQNPHAPAISQQPARPRPHFTLAADALPALSDLPPERRAIQIVASGDRSDAGEDGQDGKERQVDADAARARGLTIVDLSDGWAPGVLDGASYRSVFTALAADRGDGDGQPLAAGERNYLELYGIPPALSVLRRRFLTDAAGACSGAYDADTLLAVDQIRTWGASTEQKELARHRARATRLQAARAAGGADSLQALVEGPDARVARDAKEHLRFEAERLAFAEVEKRLACEGMMDPRKHKPGAYDTEMRTAMLDFQQKQAVMDQADIRRATLEALARPPLENDLLALERVLTERAMHAAGFIEDGSVGEPSTSGPSEGPEPPAKSSRGQSPRSLTPSDSVVGATYLGADGTRHRVPDLATAARAATFDALGIATADDAVAFFRRHARADFAWLKVAVRLPPPPEYYSKAMDLSVEIDRGDVWYDFPFDAAGVRQPQPRERFPQLTLYVKWRGERVPLVRWRTTVGGWRAELASDGQEYFRYKGSDIGPRVWRHIVTAPVWIPPPSSPLGSMVKEKRVVGTYVRVTNYDETGPGFLSAYGMVAAIHEEMRRTPDGVRYFDNGIRTHGSFDYPSLRGRFSHGCHRLYNQLAMRLFSFVLDHRKARVVGPVAAGYRRAFYSRGEVFEMRLPSRGFYRELEPPIPVEVLEGRLKGTLQKPIAGYVPKPGVKYLARRPPTASETPEDRAGGDSP